MKTRISFNTNDIITEKVLSALMPVAYPA